MSIVRRTARSNINSPISTDAFEPSRETVMKAEASKRYLENFFMKKNEQFETRKSDISNLYKALDQMNLTEEERNAILNQYHEEETNYTRLQRQKLRPENFNYIKLIGRGGFADVWLVTDKKNQVYALKIIRKSDVILNDQVQSVINERNILSKANNNWIVNLHSSFQDQDHLYLLLDFVQGGDLMNALIKLNSFPPAVCKFFAGEIALALHYVHQLGYVHSDVKPDNILINNDGHIKLTDFGIASSYNKADNDYGQLIDNYQDLFIENANIVSTANNRRHRQRNSIIGTIDYVAPEVIMGEKTSDKSDWWSFGVILYEMFYGFTPFACESKQETAMRIVHWRKSLRIPANQRIPTVALDLIRKLLCDKEDRIGFEEIIAHPFFKGFDFNNYMANNPPMRPQNTDPLDTQHFDTYEVSADELRASSCLSQLASFAFLGFSYKAKPHSQVLARIGLYN